MHVRGQDPAQRHRVPQGVGERRDAEVLQPAHDEAGPARGGGGGGRRREGCRVERHADGGRAAPRAERAGAPQPGLGVPPHRAQGAQVRAPQDSARAAGGAPLRVQAQERGAAEAQDAGAEARGAARGGRQGGVHHVPAAEHHQEGQGAQAARVEHAQARGVPQAESEGGRVAAGPRQAAEEGAMQGTLQGGGQGRGEAEGPARHRRHDVVRGQGRPGARAARRSSGGKRERKGCPCSPPGRAWRPAAAAYPGPGPRAPPPPPAPPQQHCDCFFLVPACLSLSVTTFAVGAGAVLGSFCAISANSSYTLVDALADVSMKKIPFSSAYCWASSTSTARFSARSALLPASAITRLGLPCRWSSRTQLFARAKESWFVMSYTMIAAAAPR
mmetsp:Transcript_23441/g.79780  ORF Transcript_23441/g.79780 Transcript_23441/m.79780 type:complete len:387 (+) Transcript_23441:1511-2671(+)